MGKVKITVLKKEFYPDFAEEYLTEGKEAGATYTPWSNKEGQTIVCCTDGIRPVVFKVEAY